MIILHFNIFFIWAQQLMHKPKKLKICLKFSSLLVSQVKVNIGVSHTVFSNV